MENKIRSTTILGVVRDGKAALGSDGQVTLGNTVLKHQTKKIRKLYNNSIMVGFAGSTSDALSLLEKFEEKLTLHNGRLDRAAVELAKEWRSDKYLRKLEAMLAVLSKTQALIISGTGDIIEPDDNIVAIGSGGPYALSAARALLRHTTMPAKDIVHEGLSVAGEICIYTNSVFSIDELL